MVAAVSAAVLSLVVVFCRSAAVEVAYPFERAASCLRRRVWRPISSMWNAAAVTLENESLSRSVAALAMVQEENAALAAENSRLRAALSYAEKPPVRWIPAPVIARSGGAGSVAKTLRAGKGSLAGVTEGAAVRVPEGLVGRVRGVTPHTCEIVLVSDPSVKVACETAGGGPFVRGILSGSEAEFLVLARVRGGASPAPRTPVVTSGSGGVFPRGCPVGWLVSMEETPDGLSRTGRIEPAVDFESLEDVFIRDEK